MAPSEDKLGERAPRRLQKRPRDPRRISLDIPDRLKDGADAQDDVTAPKGKNAQYMNQSIFSMIAATASQANFNARFDEASSDSDTDTEEKHKRRSEDRSTTPTPEGERQEESKKKTSKHRRLLSENKLVRSLPRLSLKPIRERKSRTGQMSSSQILPPRPSAEGRAGEELDEESAAGEGAPIMSRMLKARAELQSSVLGPEAQRRNDEVVVGTASAKPTVTDLSHRLMEIFELSSPEKVISEYPCWLMQSVLLQGYMYITEKHVCFFAYLPKKSNTTIKSGYLSKRGQRNPKYNRYWFALKGDVLSYYTNPKDLYFSSGNIDLRYGISASLSELKDKSKESTGFRVETPSKTYHFRADSEVSAKEWVKHLQKVIFRAHNDGDSVKICLPIEGIIDIEQSPVIDFAETFKIRVIDNDETYAIDEYFFSFFGYSNEAYNVLRILVDDNTGARDTDRDQASTPGPSSRHPSPLPSRSLSVTRNRASLGPAGREHGAKLESVRATLSPMSPPLSGLRSSPRASGEVPRSSIGGGRPSAELLRDASFDRGRRSFSSNRRDSSKGYSRSRPRVPATPERQESVDSFAPSTDNTVGSSVAIQSLNDTDVSASQILERSDVFHSPTLTRPHAQRAASSATVEALGRASEQTTRSSRVDKGHPHPSSGAHTSSTIPKATPHITGIDSEHDSDAQNTDMAKSASSSALNDLMKAGAYPLQKASGIAGFFKNRSKQMSSLLATESMGYYEKVSGMWAGGKRHYGDAEGLVPDDQVRDPEDEEDVKTHGDRFRAHFALPDSEKLLATYFAHLQRGLPQYGKLYVSNRRLCFRSLLPGTRTKLNLPFTDIENVDRETGFRFGYSGLVVSVRGHEELFFEFAQPEIRDDCAVTLLQQLDAVKFMEASAMLLTPEEKKEAEIAKLEYRYLQEARADGHAEHDIKLPTSANESQHESPPIIFDDPQASVLNFKPTESLRITCLTIGSRGDVQPYIALCKGFLAEGHRPKIATHAEFEPWVRKHGIDFEPVEGDPARLMQICVEHGMFTYSFMREASSKFRGWLDGLLHSAWKACQGSDILIESPSTMAGIHIAEALEIPYFRAFTMPWTRTRAYPHAFASPEHKMGGAYNYFSYVMFDTIFWKAIAHQINRWRNKELGLTNTSLDKMQQNKVPFLYNFSPSVVVPPLDFSDWVKVTGYWFLDEGNDYTPPEDLANFIRKAREDKKKLVYVGFGSIVVDDPAALTKTVVDAVLKADVRCILAKGWSERFGSKDAKKSEVALPSDIFQIQAAPHDWLFRQIDAATHHGGAGTTGASLRAGIPTIIKPFFGDQYFFGSRVEDLGVGVYLRKMNTSVFARALWQATHDERMIVKARVLGEQVRKEDGVGSAIQAIYRDMEYAKTLVKRRSTPDGADDIDEEEFENWTMIGDSESDLENLKMRNVADWESMALQPAGAASRIYSPAGGGVAGERKPSLGSSVLNKGKTRAGAS